MKPPGHAVAVLLIATAVTGCMAEKPFDQQAEAKRLEFCRSVIDAVKPNSPICGPYLDQLKREREQPPQDAAKTEGSASANRLRQSTELTATERQWVAGAMAGTGCQIIKKKVPEEVATESFRWLMTGKGIDSQSVWRDRDLANVSKIYFASMCR
jgi:hypothetical protein